MEHDMTPLTYATVCSGIECMSVASWGMPLKPVFFSEIEPFPCAVLKAHYPEVPNLGDMSKIQVSDNGKEITNGTRTIRLHANIDILAGGTPCQDVSVAGKRAGMQEGSGTRSSLAFEFVRLARELRPRWVLWENVAGCIDSKNAPDFLAFLCALGDCGYSLAWRVLDAQYVRVDGMERAVPQRRRRVWVVGCLGGDESVPAQILFEPDCVAGHTAPRRRTGEGFAYSLAGRDRVDAPVVGEPTVALDQGAGKSAVNSTVELSPVLATTHQGEPAIAVRTANTHANGHGVAEDATHTLDGVNGQGVAYGIGNGQAAEAAIAAKECCQTLNTMHDHQAICFENDHLNRCEVARSLSGNHDDRVTDSGTSVVHTNSKGEDSRSMTVNFEMFDTAKDASVCLNAQRAKDTMVVQDKGVE